LTSVQDVADEMASIADSSIEDPVSMRSNDGGTWIFSHFPKYGQGKTLPRIGIHPVDETFLPATLGSTASNTEGDIQATIVVKRGSKYDYDNDGENEEEENLLEHLKNRVIEEIETNQSQLTNLEDVAHVFPTTSTKTRPVDKNVLFKAVNFEVRINNC